MPIEWSSNIQDMDYFLDLMAPEFVEVDGLVLLKVHYTQENWEEWKKSLTQSWTYNDRKKIENTINHVHLDEISSDSKLQLEIGEFLKRQWLNELYVKFPQISFDY